MPDRKPKNRRYRNAKISEHRLRRVVECFAHNMTAKDAAKATRLSEPAVNTIYTKLREHIANFGMINRSNLTRAPGEGPPQLGAFVAHHRGVVESHKDLHEFEVINRIMAAQRFQGFERLSASDAKQVDRARRLQLQGGERNPRYNVMEVTKPRPGEPGSVTREFDLSVYRKDSDILINERHNDPSAAFFRFVWQMLLRHPL